MSMLPKVGIITLIWNRPGFFEDLELYFSSMAKMTYPKDRVVLFCHENISPQGEGWSRVEKELLPRFKEGDLPKIFHTATPNIGFAAGNNYALRYVKEEGCEYVFILNEDCDVDSNFLSASVARAEANPKIAYVQSLLLLGQDRNAVNSNGNCFHFLGYGYAGGYKQSADNARQEIAMQKTREGDTEIAYFSGAATLGKMSIVNQYGLFDDTFFMYHEDTDAAFAAKVHGYNVVIEPLSVVYHHYVFSRSMTKYYWMERNRYVILLSYYKLPTLFLIAPVFFGVEFASLYFSLRSGWWKEKKKAWAFFWKISTWKWIAERRRQIQSTRTVSDRDLLRRAESRIIFQEGDAHSWVVEKIANPVLTIFWKIIYFLIRW